MGGKGDGGLEQKGWYNVSRKWWVRNTNGWKSNIFLIREKKEEFKKEETVLRVSKGKK